MSSWNYRLIRVNEEDVEIAEVYYTNDGVPTSWAFRTTGGSCIQEIEETLSRQRSALSKSVLVIQRTERGDELVDTRERLSFRATEEPAGEAPTS